MKLHRVFLPGPNDQLIAVGMMELSELAPGLDGLGLTFHVVESTKKSDVHYTQPKTTTKIRIAKDFVGVLTSGNRWYLRDQELIRWLSEACQQATDRTKFLEWICHHLRRCWICSAALTDHHSIARGMGETCAKKAELLLHNTLT